MSFTTFLFLPLLCISSYGQIRLTTLDGSRLPKNFKYVAHLINAVKWTDSLGLNYVMTTETGEVQSKSSDEKGVHDAALYTYHYVVGTDNATLIWKVYDFNNECDLDLSLYFLTKRLPKQTLIETAWVKFG